MKKLLAVAVFVLTAALSARAQWVVYDPTMNIQQIIDQMENIAKYVQMIDNQVQQIQTLTAQLNEFKNYEALFGNPAKVLLPTIQPLVNDLTKTELGQTLTTLEGAVNAGQAMLYSDNGLFHSVGTTFTTPDGQTVTALASAVSAGRRRAKDDRQLSGRLDRRGSAPGGVER